MLFRSEDVDDLARSLAGLLDDPGRRAAIDEAAQVAVRRYDWSTVATQILQVYETVTTGRPVMALASGWPSWPSCVAAGAAGLWLSWTANRLDRMHHRIDVARASLDTQLLRRSGAALELATSGTLDPARSLLLVDAASQARGGSDDFESAESDLSEALRAVLADADEVRALREDEAVGPLLTELAGDCRKVELARRFHNDVVASARALRSRRRVRWLRLAGHAAPLQTVDLDDVPPTPWLRTDPVRPVRHRDVGWRHPPESR